MALSTAQPWRHSKSDILHLPQRTLGDLVARLEGARVMLSLGDGVASVKVVDTVQLSLKTTDFTRGKELHAVADAALRRFWEGHRSGPKRPSYKDAAALAETLYADFARIEDDPGSPETRIKASGGNREARSEGGALNQGDARAIQGLLPFGNFLAVVWATNALIGGLPNRDMHKHLN